MEKQKETKEVQKTENKKKAVQVHEVAFHKSVRVNGSHVSSVSSRTHEVEIKEEGIVIKTEKLDVLVPNSNIAFIAIEK